MTDEQIIIAFARETGTSTFTKKELVAQAGYNPNQDNFNRITVLLTRLTKKGYFIRVKKGLYAINFKKYSF